MASRSGTRADVEKPCPFCGSDHIVYDDSGDSEWLTCANCGANGGYSPDAYAADLSIEQAWDIRFGETVAKPDEH